MDFIQNFPFFSIIASLLTAILIFIIRPKHSKKVLYCLLGLNSILSLVTLLYCLYTEKFFVYKLGHFPAPWGNELRAGVLESFFALFFVIILLFSVIGGKKHLEKDVKEKKIGFYTIMICLIQASLLTLIYANDIFTSYVFLEICTISSCGLLMIRQIGRTTLAAIRYMIFNLLGSGLFLIGVSMLYDITGHLLMSHMKEKIETIIAAGQYTLPLFVTVACIALGLAIKSGLFPFHFWMPDTYGYSTTTSAAVLSGIVSKGYIFLLIKIIYRVVGFEVLSSTHILNILYVFGLIGMIVGSLSAIKENNINRMIAFSFGGANRVYFMGIGLGSSIGIVAALFHMLTHAITKPLLFISSSRLIDVSENSKKFIDLQGSSYRAPISGIAFSIASLSMVGIPVFAGFVSKLLFASAAVGTLGKTLPTLIVLAISTVLNTIYFLKTVIRIYTPKTEKEGVSENLFGFKKQKSFAIVMFFMILVNMFLGLHSQPVVDLLEKGIRMFLSI